jgi:dethiobiotin synthetase
MSPLTDNSPLGDYNANLAADLGYPLVIVAANRLGVINAVLQTVVTARTLCPQLPIAGVVLNQVESVREDASVGSNAEELRARCEMPLLAVVDFGEREFSPEVDWEALVF